MGKYDALVFISSGLPYLRTYSTTRWLHDYDVIDLGDGAKLEILHTPGHTPDSICIFYDAECRLFVGDFIYRYSPILVVGPQSSIEEFEGSCAKLMEFVENKEQKLRQHMTLCCGWIRHIWRSFWTCCSATEQLTGYKTSLPRIVITALLTLLTFGLLALVLYWKPAWRAAMTGTPCRPTEADRVLIEQELVVEMRKVGVLTNPQGGNVEILHPQTKKAIQLNRAKYFTFRRTMYVLWPEFGSFYKASTLDGAALEDLRGNKGLESVQASNRAVVYGRNEIDIRLRSIPYLLFREVLNPFYVFQAFSVTLWFCDEYIYYASCVVVLTTLSCVTEVYQLRQNQRRLRDTVQNATEHDQITVLRSGEPHSSPLTALVPGDEVVLDEHTPKALQADMVLLSGHVLVNESMLTGESVPITKTELELSDGTHQLYCPDTHHSRHTLFSGTTILQLKNKPVHAIIVRTGFSTAKGRLCRAIMFPKPANFEFFKDVFKMIGVLSLIALCGMVYSFTLKIMEHTSIKELFVESLDIVTIVVPPALPAAMTIGIMFARRRLRKANVFCISPTTINTCGGIDTVIFDKTGTLTEDGLGLRNVLPVDKGAFGELVSGLLDLRSDHPARLTGACCHSLDAEMNGDPLEKILFESSEWSIQTFDDGSMDVLTSPDQSISMTKVREFPFTSALARMSVIVEQDNGTQLLYTKGSPEAVEKLCKQNSLPKDFSEHLHRYAQSGYRVIALAYRELPGSAKTLNRADAESNLTLAGLVMFENCLKPETRDTLNQLHHAKVRLLMATGDHLLTGASVACECDLVPPGIELLVLDVEEKADSVPRLTVRPYDRAAVSERVGSSYQETVEGFKMENGVANGVFNSHRYALAMSGTTYTRLREALPSDQWSALLCSTSVLARMTPEQKAELIEDLLRDRPEAVVAMCGDGANDCGALKAAHVGISLSDAEASIASPFTYTKRHIGCVPTVILEGRAALVTSFSVFKYMAIYSLTQFLSVLLLYWIATNLSDFQFLYIDMFLITWLALSFGYTAATKVLVPRPPPSRLVSLETTTSLIIQAIIMIATQVFTFLIVTTQPWFVPFVDPPGDDESFDSYQVTCVFLISCYQYIVQAIVYNPSAPYRKSILSNVYLSIALVVTTAVTLYLTLGPPQFAIDLLELKLPPMMEFRAELVAIAAGFAVLALGSERALSYAFAKRHTGKNQEDRQQHVGNARPRTWLESLSLKPLHPTQSVSTITETHNNGEALMRL